MKKHKTALAWNNFSSVFLPFYLNYCHTSELQPLVHKERLARPNNRYLRKCGTFRIIVLCCVLFRTCFLFRAHTPFAFCSRHLVHLTVDSELVRFAGWNSGSMVSITSFAFNALPETKLLKSFISDRTQTESKSWSVAANLLRMLFRISSYSAKLCCEISTEIMPIIAVKWRLSSRVTISWWSRNAGESTDLELRT